MADPTGIFDPAIFDSAIFDIWDEAQFVEPEPDRSSAAPARVREHPAGAHRVRLNDVAARSRRAAAISRTRLHVAAARTREDDR